MIYIFSLFQKNVYHALSTNVMVWLSLLNCKSWQITGIMSFNYYNSKSFPWCSVENFSIYNFFNSQKISLALHRLFQLLNNKSVLLQTTWKSQSPCFIWSNIAGPYKIVTMVMYANTFETIFYIPVLTCYKILLNQVSLSYWGANERGDLDLKLGSICHQDGRERVFRNKI